MKHPLGGAHAKVRRARDHLGALEQEVARYLQTGPIHVDQREEREGEMRHIRWIATSSTEPPETLGLLIGDWANNARAALDYVVYELVRRETGEADPRWTQFPIVTAAGRYAAQATRVLKGTPDWSSPVFEGLQPYHDGGDAPDHHLAILADVSNRDKHRLVHTAAMQIAGSQARVHGTGMKAIYELGQNPGTVIGERVILDAVLAVDSDDYNIELQVEISVGLENYEVPITPMLGWITAEVGAIVEWFTPALA